MVYRVSGVLVNCGEVRRACCNCVNRTKCCKLRGKERVVISVMLGYRVTIIVSS